MNEQEHIYCRQEKPPSHGICYITLHYRVLHKRLCIAIRSYSIDIDFAGNYGIHDKNNHCQAGKEALKERVDNYQQGYDP